MAGRNSFTPEEDTLLVKYIAKYNPTLGGRSGNHLYKLLEEDPEGKWSWSRRHTWQSWRDRYCKNQDEFNRRIKIYQRKHNIHSDGRDVAPIVRVPNEKAVAQGKRKRPRLSEGESKEGKRQKIQEEKKDKQPAKPASRSKEEARKAKNKKRSEESESEEELGPAGPEVFKEGDSQDGETTESSSEEEQETTNHTNRNANEKSKKSHRPANGKIYPNTSTLPSPHLDPPVPGPSSATDHPLPSQKRALKPSQNPPRRQNGHVPQEFTAESPPRPSKRARPLRSPSPQEIHRRTSVSPTPSLQTEFFTSAAASDHDRDDLPGHDPKRKRKLPLLVEGPYGTSFEGSRRSGGGGEADASESENETWPPTRRRSDGAGVVVPKSHKEVQATAKKMVSREVQTTESFAGQDLRVALGVTSFGGGKMVRVLLETEPKPSSANGSRPRVETRAGEQAKRPLEPQPKKPIPHSQPPSEQAASSSSQRQEVEAKRLQAPPRQELEAPAVLDTNTFLALLKEREKALQDRDRGTIPVRLRVSPSVRVNGMPEPEAGAQLPPQQAIIFPDKTASTAAPREREIAQHGQHRKIMPPPPQPSPAQVNGISPPSRSEMPTPTPASDSVKPKLKQPSEAEQRPHAKEVQEAQKSVSPVEDPGKRKAPVQVNATASSSRVLGVPRAADTEKAASPSPLPVDEVSTPVTHHHPFTQPSPQVGVAQQIQETPAQAEAPKTVGTTGMETRVARMLGRVMMKLGRVVEPIDYNVGVDGGDAGSRENGDEVGEGLDVVEVSGEETVDGGGVDGNAEGGEEELGDEDVGEGGDNGGPPEVELEVRIDSKKLSSGDQRVNERAKSVDDEEDTDTDALHGLRLPRGTYSSPIKSSKRRSGDRNDSRRLISSGRGGMLSEGNDGEDEVRIDSKPMPRQNWSPGNVFRANASGSKDKGKQRDNANKKTRTAGLGERRHTIDNILGPIQSKPHIDLRVQASKRLYAQRRRSLPFPAPDAEDIPHSRRASFTPRNRHSPMALAMRTPQDDYLPFPIEITPEDQAKIDYLGMKHAIEMMAGNHGFKEEVVWNMWRITKNITKTDEALMRMKIKAEEEALEIAEELEDEEEVEADVDGSLEESDSEEAQDDQRSDDSGDPAYTSHRELPEQALPLNDSDHDLYARRRSSNSKNHRDNRWKERQLQFRPSGNSEDRMSDYAPPLASRAGQYVRLVKQGRKDEALMREHRRAKGGLRSPSRAFDEAPYSSPIKAGMDLSGTKASGSGVDTNHATGSAQATVSLPKDTVEDDVFKASSPAGKHARGTVDWGEKEELAFLNAHSGNARSLREIEKKVDPDFLVQRIAARFAGFAERKG